MTTSTSNPFIFFSKDTNESMEPSLSFNSVDMDQLAELKVTSSTIDVDYLLLHGSPPILFDAPSVLNLLGTHSGKLEKALRKVKVYSTTFTNGIYVFGTISNFNIGISAHVNLPKHDEESSLLVKTINGILFDINGSYPFRDIKNIIKSRFHSFDVVIFCHGQKTPITLLENLLIEMPSLCTMEIALGIEHSLQNSFLSFKLDENYKNFCYSNFLSNTSCNLLIDDQTIASKLANNSYRLIIYNTLQHEKTKIAYEFSKLSADNDDSITSVQTLFGDSIKGTISNIFKFANNLTTSKLRIEVYYIITPSNLECCKLSLTLLINKLSFVQISLSNIQKFIKSICLNYMNLFNRLKCSSDAKDYMYLLYIYYLAISAIFSLRKMNSKSFLDENYGVALPTFEFDPKTKEFSIDFLKRFTPSKLSSLLYEIFTNSLDMNECRIFIMLSYVHYLYSKNMPLIDGNLYIIKNSIDFIKERLVTSKRTDSIKKNDIVYLPVHEWMNKLIQKFSHRPLFNKLMRLILSFQETNMPFYSAFLAEVKSINVHIFDNRVSYLVDNGTVMYDPNPITIYSLLGFTQKYSYEKCSSLLDSNIELTLENTALIQTVDKVFSWLNAATVKYCEKCKIYDFKYAIDMDIIFRLLFMSIPLVNENNTKALLAIEYFGNTSIFEQFAALIIIQYYLSININKTFTKKTSNFTRLHLRTISRFRFSFTQLSYLTGLFKDTNDVCMTTLSFPLKKKFRSLISLPPQQRRLFFGQQVIKVHNLSYSNPTNLYLPILNRYNIDLTDINDDNIETYLSDNADVTIDTNQVTISSIVSPTPNSGDYIYTDHDDLSLHHQILSQDVILSPFLSSILSLELKIADVKKSSEEALQEPFKVLLHIDSFSAKLLARKLKLLIHKL